MRWQTQVRIANEVSQRLEIPKSTIEADRLKESVLAPDKWRLSAPLWKIACNRKAMDESIRIRELPYPEG